MDPTLYHPNVSDDSVKLLACVISAALDAGPRGLLVSHMYGYAHFFVYAGIVVMAVGLEEVLLSTAPEGHGGHSPEGERDHAWTAGALFGGTALAVAGSAVVSRAAATGLPGGALGARLVAVGLLIALGASAKTLGVPPPALLFCVSAIAIGLVAVEIAILPHPRELRDEAGRSDR